MNLRVFLSALLGGVLGTLCLALPLYFVLPARYDSAWSALSPTTGTLGYLLTVLVTVGTGYGAARWCWAASIGACLHAGVLAGMLTGLIAFWLIGAAAAGVAGNGPVFLHGMRPLRDDTKAIFLIAECAVRVGWWPYLTFWSLFLGGAVLGGLGGWIYRLQAAPAWGATPPPLAAEPLDAAFAIMVSTSLSLLAVVAVIAALAVDAQTSALLHEFELSLPARGVLDWPVAMNLIVITTATWFCGRWCATRWNHPIPGVRRTTRMGAVTMTLLPLVTLSLLGLIDRAALADPVLLLGAGTWVGVVLFWLVRTGAEPDPLAPRRLPPQPRLRDRLLINAGVVGVLAPALVMATGVSQALSLALGVVAFIDVLFDRTAAASSAPFMPTSVAEAIQAIFLIHLTGSLFIALSWCFLAGIHSGVVMLWQARRQAQLSVRTGA